MILVSETSPSPPLGMRWRKQGDVRRPGCASSRAAAPATNMLSISTGNSARRHHRRSGRVRMSSIPPWSWLQGMTSDSSGGWKARVSPSKIRTPLRHAAAKNPSIDRGVKFALRPVIGAGCGSVEAPRAPRASRTIPAVERPPPLGSVLNDTTLRDGGQAPSIAFTRAESEISHALATAGMCGLETGTPAIKAGEVTAGAFGRSSILMLPQQDNRLSSDAVVGMSMQQSPPTFRWSTSPCQLSDRRITVELRGDHAHPKILTAHVIECAHITRAGSRCRRQGSSRAEPDFLVELAIAVARAPTRAACRVADTLGVLDPFSSFALIEQFRRETDWRSATGAMTIWDWPRPMLSRASRRTRPTLAVTMIGLGGRAGNTQLEEVADGGDSALWMRHRRSARRSAGDRQACLRCCAPTHSA